MSELARGALSKMAAQLDAPVQYSFRLGDELLPVNPLIGKTLRLEFLGAIHCSHCGRKTKSSYSQGYCYPCMQKLAQCDICIMSPERCHYRRRHLPRAELGRAVLHDRSRGLPGQFSVGQGRYYPRHQIPTRWIDQGASQALPILRVATRQQSGFVEDLLRSQVADKTNWRALLKGDAAPVDLTAVREQLFASCSSGLTELQQRFGIQAIQPLSDQPVVQISYPIEAYPAKITSFNLDKNPLAEGTLLGIKGQYLMFDTGVINIRKYTAYQLAVHELAV